jgi:hypothetical protein
MKEKLQKDTLPATEQETSQPQNMLPEQLPISFDELIKKELVKFDVVVPKIEELKNQCMPLTIKSVDDREGYEKVSKALRFVVGKRTAVEDKRKELKADSLKFGQAVDGRAKEIAALLAPIETHLKTLKDGIDSQVKEIEAKKERDRLEKIQQRHKALLAQNMPLIGNEYQWVGTEKEETLLSLNIETMSDESFEEYRANVALLNDREKELIEEENRKTKEERLQFIADKENLEKEQEEIRLQQQQANMEMDNLMNERLSMRLERLSNLGFTISSNPDVLSHPYGVTVNISEVKSMPTITWDELLFEKSNSLTLLKIEKEKKDNYDDRVNVLATMSFSFTGEGDIIYEGSVVGATEIITTATQEQWIDYLVTLTKRKDSINSDIAAEKAAKEIEEKEAADKAAQELADKIIADKEAADKAAQELADKIIADKAAADKAAKDAADKAEAERVSNLSDKNKVKEYAQKLLDVEPPVTTTTRWTKEVNSLIATLKTFQA